MVDKEYILNPNTLFMILLTFCIIFLVISYIPIFRSFYKEQIEIKKRQGHNYLTLSDVLLVALYSFGCGGIVSFIASLLITGFIYVFIKFPLISLFCFVLFVLFYKMKDLKIKEIN